MIRRHHGITAFSTFRLFIFDLFIAKNFHTIIISRFAQEFLPLYYIVVAALPSHTMAAVSVLVAHRFQDVICGQSSRHHHAIIALRHQRRVATIECLFTAESNQYSSAFHFTPLACVSSWSRDALTRMLFTLFEMRQYRAIFLRACLYVQ